MQGKCLQRNPVSMANTDRFSICSSCFFSDRCFLFFLKLSERFVQTILPKFHPLYCCPQVVHEMLLRVVGQSLDICGLRVLYPSTNTPTTSHTSTVVSPSASEAEGGITPVLAVALRGPHARVRLNSIVGPMDYILAKKTDPLSLTALYGTVKEGLQVCVYVCVRACVHACAHARVCVCTCVCAYMCVCVCMHARVPTRLYGCMHIILWGFKHVAFS